MQLDFYLLVWCFLRHGKDIPFTKKKPIDVNWQRYLKQFENDSVQGMCELLFRANCKVKFNVGGKEISDSAEILRAMEQNAKEEMSRNNNKIEKIP